MVRPAMAERELEGLVVRGDAEQLVPETDAEDGNAAEEVAHDGRLVLERLRIARPVREDDAVVARELVGVDGVRIDGHRDARAGEPPQDRAASSRSRRPRPAAGRARRRRTARAWRPARPAPGPPSRPPPAGISSPVPIAAHIAPRSRRCRTSERVSIPSTRDDAVLAQPVRPRGTLRLAHDDALHVGAGRLRAALADPVVADHRSREAQDLLRVARVGDELLVAGHRGREDGLAEGHSLGADRLTAEDRPVLECEVSPLTPV